MYVCSIGTICQGTAHAQVISMYWRHLLRLLSFFGFFDEVGFPLLYLFFSSFGVQEGTANLSILTVDHRVFSFPSPFCGVKYPCQVLVEERSKVNPIVSDYQFYISSSTFFFFPFTSETKLRCRKGKQLFTLFFTAALDSPSCRSTALKNGIRR